LNENRGEKIVIHFCTVAPKRTAKMTAFQCHALESLKQMQL